MGENNKIDEFDKMFYDYFDNNKEVPQRIHDTIYSAFDRRRQKRKRANILKKVAMIIVTFGVMTTGIVFADDIINFITSLFTNSTDGIESAVQNGYAQTVDMEYVYDNNIGVKVDNLVLDDTNLDISFIYNYQGDDKINSLELYKYIIKDEKNNILYELDRNETYKENISIATQLRKDNDIVLIDENKYKESLLYTSEKFLNCKEITIEISQIKIITNNNSNVNVRNGNWNISIQIGETLKNRESEFYEIKNNKYLNDGKVELTETSLKIKLRFQYKLDEQIFNDKDNIILIDSTGKNYYYKFSDMKYIDNDSELYLEYDIGKYFSNIEDLKLVIKHKEKIELIFLK